MECMLLSMALADEPDKFRLPSEREIVKKTEVSLITVQRALEELASKKIIERRHGSGNYPLRKPSLEDLLAIVNVRRLAMYSEETFHTSTLLRYDLLFFIQQRLVNSGVDLLLFNQGVELAELKRRSIEGIFICGREFPPELQKSDLLPRVQLAAIHPRKFVDVILPDMAEAGRQAAQMIKKSRRKEIYMIGGAGIDEEVGRHLFLETRKHLPSDIKVHETYGSGKENYSSVRKWLARATEVRVCVLSGFYLSTAMVIRASDAESRTIGDDILLLAYGSNNVIFKDVAPLQILRVDRHLMADYALQQMLLRIIAPQLPARTVKLPLHFL